MSKPRPQPRAAQRICRFVPGDGLGNMSCSPFRVPVARLAAAQAAIREKRATWRHETFGEFAGVIQDAVSGLILCQAVAAATGGGGETMAGSNQQAGRQPHHPPPDASVPQAIDRNGLDALIRVLRDRGFTVVGPTVEQEAIVYDQITGIADLPENVADEQAPGHYRLKQRSDGALFGYNVGPSAWKKFLFPPEQRLWQIRRIETGFERTDAPTQQPTDSGDGPPYAFLGVRACERQAIAVQDRVFTGSDFEDPNYAGRREGAFIIVVNCGQAGGTCFCVSMQTGPKAESGYDLALTELPGGQGSEGGQGGQDSQEHAFVVEVGTERGAQVLAEVPHRAATDAERTAADAAVAHAAAQMGRSMDTTDIQDLLQRNFHSPRWDEVADRCLACANCTLVCPTCFCSDIEDVSDLSGDIAERWRRWGSCFTQDFSLLHDHSVRQSTRARYRQWLTHKLSTWFDQFGSSGCVGCGRCITWCPVGIDITEEVAAIREHEQQAQRSSDEKGESP